MASYLKPKDDEPVKPLVAPMPSTILSEAHRPMLSVVDGGRMATAEASERAKRRNGR